MRSLRGGRHLSNQLLVNATNKTNRKQTWQTQKKPTNKIKPNSGLVAYHNIQPGNEPGSLITKTSGSFSNRHQATGNNK